MKRYKELFKNISILTISNFGSKLLCFFLVPLYTAVLTTEEYGSFDLVSVTTSLLVPLLTICIYEGALRFLLDDSKSKKDVCSISLKIVILSLIFFFAIVLINYIFDFVGILNDYLIYFIFSYIVTIFYQYTSNVVRGLNKIGVLAIGGIVNSAIMLVFNILFLLVFKWGIGGYFIANIVANTISVIYMAIHSKLYKNISLENNDKTLEKEMINYSAPLMMNSVGWWINSASDRYVVTYLCGTDANGIYSVAYKIPSILSVFQSIFNQAWGISAVKEFDEKDSEGYFSKAYKTYNILMVFTCSFLILFTQLLAKFLYMKEFYNAWVYVPFLALSVVFGALSGFLGGVFSAVKESKILGKTTILGAFVNLTLNIILVLFLGPIGAAISTAVSYILVWGIRVKCARKYIKLHVNFIRDIVAYCLMIFQCIAFFALGGQLYVYIIEMLLVSILFCLYFKEIKSTLLSIFKNRRKEHET